MHLNMHRDVLLRVLGHVGFVCWFSTVIDAVVDFEYHVFEEMCSAIVLFSFKTTICINLLPDSDRNIPVQHGDHSWSMTLEFEEHWEELHCRCQMDSVKMHRSHDESEWREHHVKKKGQSGKTITLFYVRLISGSAVLERLWSHVSEIRSVNRWSEWWPKQCRHTRAQLSEKWNSIRFD
jgi:hypothetical protein